MAAERVFTAPPEAKLLREQAEWLAPARSRLFRQVAIAHKSRILDLGAGSGFVSQELVQRSRGFVVALDLDCKSLHEIGSFDALLRVAGRSPELPLLAASIDLVFCQCALLWMAPLEATVAEIWRVLQPGGVLVAIEPDYGGLIEHPKEVTTRELWLSVLPRAGADPFVGRKLPGILDAAGFDIRINLLDRLQTASDTRLEFLRGLPLADDERRQLRAIKQREAQMDGWSRVAHLPYFLIVAKKS